jgi:hypothetical protein
MKMDLDALVNEVLPWQCELKIDGTWYKVRPPTLKDVDALMKLANDKSISEVEAAQMVEALFDEPKPDLQSKSMTVFNGAVHAIVAYIGQYASKKNSEELSAKIRERASSTSSNASSPS